MNETEYAGFWIRVGAAIIDSILLLIVTSPILTAIYGSGYWYSEAMVQGVWDLLLSFVFPALAVMLFWVARSATPGKMATRLTIVDARTGRKPSTSQFVVRYLGYFVAALPLLLGVIWVGIDKRKQGWHDKMAGTVVIRNRRPEPVQFSKGERIAPQFLNGAHSSRPARTSSPERRNSEQEPAMEWTADLIRSLEWKRFEEFCALYFVERGRKAKVTRRGADDGIDILLYSHNDPDRVLGVVQCKAWNSRLVGVSHVREMLGIMSHERCPLGVYITTSGYSDEAVEFALGHEIKLLTATDLVKLVQELPEASRQRLLRFATHGD